MYQRCDVHSSCLPSRYDQGRDTLVTLTEDLICIQSTVGQFGKLDPPSESKLSGRRLLAACWVGDGVLATATDEARLSVWSLAMMDNYVLEPPSSTKKLSLIHVAYAEDGKLLAGVAVNGTVCMWRHNGGPFESGAAQWIEQIPVAIDAAVTHVITGGAAKPIVAVQTEHGVEILREHVMKCAYGGHTSVLQTASNRAIIEHGLKTSQDLEVRALGTTHLLLLSCPKNQLWVHSKPCTLVVQLVLYSVLSPRCNVQQSHILFVRSDYRYPLPSRPLFARARRSCFGLASR